MGRKYYDTIMARKIVNRAGLLFFAAALIILSAGSSQAMEFSTKYATVHYSDYKDMDDFLYKLGGEHVDFLNNPQLAAGLIDRIVDRIQAILGVIPRDLRFSIYLRRGLLEKEMKAYYDSAARAVYISVDYASERILAHELSHAIINNYFPSRMPSKMQEILSQYVDKYLWSDY